MGRVRLASGPGRKDEKEPPSVTLPCASPVADAENVVFTTALAPGASVAGRR